MKSNKKNTAPKVVFQAPTFEEAQKFMDEASQAYQDWRSERDVDDWLERRSDLLEWRLK